MPGKPGETQSSKGPAASKDKAPSCAKRDARKPRVRELCQSELYQAIRRDLLDQLEQNGTTGQHFTDLVEDYMAFWVDKCMLTEDIQKRGVSVTYNNGGGQRGHKKNDSIAEKIRVNAQMLNILNALGLKAVPDGGGDPDGFEL